MQRAYLLIIAFFLTFAIKAQKTLPGGVQGVSVWNVTQSQDSLNAQWNPRLKNISNTGLVIAGKGKTMNFNPALTFDSNTIGVEKSLNLGSLKSFSLFTVCQEIDTTNEQAIISIENDTASEMVLTNKRIALLDALKYANFSKKKSYPRIYSYTQNKQEQTSPASNKIRFGQAPRYQSLPILAYHGLVPEIIVFNRNVSFNERLRVESYLAIKYGISLNQEIPVNYLNSRGEIIWNADLNSGFHNNIAGVGRDETSGLNQLVSESLQTPGLMKIGLTGQVQDNFFLIWGDDNGELRFSDKAGIIRKFGRTWKISTFGGSNIPVSVETNVMSFSEIGPLNIGETYWMMIDKSGTGSYPSGKTDFVKCNPMTSPRGTVHFDGINFDRDSMRNNIFTLLAAPDFFTRSSVVNPNCSQAQSGKIQTDIAGGQAPYRLSIQGITNTSYQQDITISGNNHTFEGIEQGAYMVKAIDAQQQVYNEKVWVSNLHIWQNLISANYTINQGEMLELDASRGMPVNNYNYSWKTPDGTTVSNEKISINQPGNYLLSVTDNEGCNSTAEVNVLQINGSNLKKTELFPNPVTNGWFVLRINLNHVANVHLSISDVSGSIIKQTILENDKFYWYNGTVSGKGIYFITLTSGGDKETLKLIAL
jgi:hypothetical protein